MDMSGCSHWRVNTACCCCPAVSSCRHMLMPNNGWPCTPYTNARRSEGPPGAEGPGPRSVSWPFPPAPYLHLCSRQPPVLPPRCVRFEFSPCAVRRLPPSSSPLGSLTRHTGQHPLKTKIFANSRDSNLENLPGNQGGSQG